MKGVKLKQVLAILLTALCASAQLSPQSVKPPEPESPAAALLNDSYAIASHFDVDERVPYLVNLTEVAVDIAPPEKVKIWCRKLFADSFQLSNPQMRIAEEKNALVPLSKIDAQLAMDLFPKVEDPPAGNLSEDVRANAATHIFPNYWHLNGIKGLSTIQQMARHIGESGEYPYRAMGLILAELAKSKENPESRQKVGGILRDALEFYQLGESRFRNRNIEFLDLLEMGKPFSSDVQYSQAVTLFLGHLTTEKPPKENFSGEVYTTKGVFKFTDLNQQLLFRGFKLIAEFAPQRVPELVQQHPDLKQANTDIESFSSGVVLGNPTPDEALRLQGEMSQKALLSRIESLQKNSPEEALVLAETLRSPAMRITARTYVLPRSNPATARGIYVQQLEEIEGLKDGPDKLNALVSVAKSAFFVRDLNNFDVLSIAVLDKGEKLFTDDVRRLPRWRAEVHEGFDQMTDIVEFNASHGSGWLANRVSQMGNQTLKAYLLIYAAKGINEAAHNEPAHTDQAVTVAGIK